MVPFRLSSLFASKDIILETLNYLRFYRMNVFRMNIEYDSGNRVTRRETIFELYSNVSSYDYHYDQLGSLTRVDHNDQAQWNYAYDSDGRLDEIENERSRTALRYDSHGR